MNNSTPPKSLHRIELCEPDIGPAEQQWVTKCLASGFVSSVGPMITEFEKMFADYTGAKYAIATATGTAAIHAALRASGLTSGSSAIVQDLTFVASSNPVLYCGAEAMLIDIEPTQWGIDPRLLDTVLARLKRKGLLPSAIIPVHLYGGACDITAIVQTAARFGVSIIEDATESLGTFVAGRHVGTFGTAGCFSFNGNKLITTGCGGMVVTNDTELSKRIRYLVNQARDSASIYLHGEMGYNYRMSNVAAALGIAQMGRIEDILARKKSIADRYETELRNLPGITLYGRRKDVKQSHWLNSVLLSNKADRDSLLEYLTKNGITARRFFEPLHRQPYMKNELWVIGSSDACLEKGGLSDEISERGINLPSSAALNVEDQQKVIGAIKSWTYLSTQAYNCPSEQEIQPRKKAS